MCNNNEANDCRCISEILTVIAILQKNAVCPESCLDACDRPVLGGGPNCLIYNTRPVMLVLCKGTALSMPSERNSTVQDSNVFRIEKLDNGCATFRVLQTSETGFITTNSFFTITMDCICCIKCLSDTYVDLV